MLSNYLPEFYSDFWYLGCGPELHIVLPGKVKC